MDVISHERVRLAKALVESGRFDRYEAALEFLEQTEVAVKIGEAAATPAGQAAFLTAVATSVRAFGSVLVQGALDAGLLVPLVPGARDLRAAAVELGAFESGSLNAKTILIGEDSVPPASWSVRTFANRWTAGIQPGTAKPKPQDQSNALAGIFAGAMAVAQVFRSLEGRATAGRREAMMSLWHPEGSPTDRGPQQFKLPKEAWLVGLGHLGQGYLWSLAALPYARPEDLLLVLQDDDDVEAPNWGTSLVVPRGKYGDPKTRYGLAWAKARSFRTKIIERFLDGHTRVADDGREPRFAMAGLHDLETRKLMAATGFNVVMDGGLGAKHSDFMHFAVNIFHAGRSAARHWEGALQEQTKQREHSELNDPRLALPAYTALATRDPCGAAMLAGKSVAGAFVGAAAGAVMAAQAVRLASTGTCCEAVIGPLDDVTSVRASRTCTPDLGIPYCETWSPHPADLSDPCDGDPVREAAGATLQTE